MKKITTKNAPYIINKIPYDYWKIVTRKGSLIKTFDAKDFDLGKSHHDRFMSLINHPFRWLIVSAMVLATGTASAQQFGDWTVERSRDLLVATAKSDAYRSHRTREIAK